MKRYQLFLAYYTILASLGLFIWSIFFAQNPQGFLLTLLVIPIGIYFGLLVAGVAKSKPTDTSSENNTHKKYPSIFLIVLTTLFISSFSIFVYSAISNRSLDAQSASLLKISKHINGLQKTFESQNETLYKELTKDIQDVKTRLIDIKTSQKNSEEKSVLDAATALQVGTVTIKDQKNQTVTVYQEKNSSSKTVGKAEFGTIYTFIEKDKDWYLILLGEKEGFISSQFVKEIVK